MLSGQYTGQPVDASDAFGMTLVEAIWRGLNWRMRFRGLEFNRTGILSAIHTFGSTGLPTATFAPTLANIGNRYSLFAQVLVLTAILGSPPTFVQTLTADGAVVSPQSSVEYIMTSKVREAPFEMVLLPYEVVISSVAMNVSFTTT